MGCPTGSRISCASLGGLRGFGLALLEPLLEQTADELAGQARLGLRRPAPQLDYLHAVVALAVAPRIALGLAERT